MNSKGNKIPELKKFIFPPEDTHCPDQDKTAGHSVALEPDCGLPKAQRDVTAIRAAERPETSQERH